jgi:two-component system, cell cycle response regulator
MADDKKKKDGGDFAPDPTERTTVVDLKKNQTGANRKVAVMQIAAGNEQGRIIVIQKNMHVTMGRSKECTLPIHDPSCSRNHAELFSTSDGAVFLKDLGSTNGTRVNGQKISDPVPLKDGDRIQLGDNTVIRFSIVPEDEAHMQEDVYKRATRDPLTNAFNRRQFEEVLNRELSFQKRNAQNGLGIIMFDVDHFKKVNDSFGHLAGDEVLRGIGQRVPTLIRTEDVFARLGGEEFAVLVRNDTIEGIKILSERLRESMEKKPAEFEGRAIPFTVSVGSTLLLGAQTMTPEALVQLADEALYDAKHNGRNRCVFKLPKS